MKQNHTNSPKTQKQFVIILLLIVNCALIIPSTRDCFGQSITWQRTYGTIGYEEGYSIVQTPDSGYIAVGRKRINSIEHMYVFRMNKFGDVIWERVYPNDWARRIIKTNDNNYLVMGMFTTLIKIDISGNMLWQSGPYSYDKTFSSVKETNTGDFVICGAIDIGFRRYPYLFQLSSLGDSLWEKTFTDNIFEGRFSDIVLANNGDFIMCGNISDSSFISDKFSIVRVDQTGNELWFRRYDTLLYYNAYSMTTAIDGFLIGGQYLGALIIRTDTNGFIEWIKQYDEGTSGARPLCKNILTTNDNNYVYTGIWDSTGNLDFYMRVRKVDQNGIEIWRRSFGFSGNEYGDYIIQTSDSGFASIGFTDYGNINEDIYIVKMDKNGNTVPYIGIEPISSTMPAQFKLYQNHPNPFNPVTDIKFDITKSTNVKLTVVNLLGQEVEILVNQNLVAGSYTADWNASNFASGVYFYKLVAGEFVDVKKMVLLK